MNSHIYASHIKELADELSIEIIPTKGGGRASRRRRWVKIPAVRGQVSYLIALHELGHIAVTPEPPLRLAQEVAAWQWALDNAIDEPTIASWRSVLRRLESYSRRQERWASMKRPPEFDLFIHRLQTIVHAGRL
jgi:hypothetical protein